MTRAQTGRRVETLAAAIAALTSAAVTATADAEDRADEIVVSASATPLAAIKVGSAVTVVTAEDLKSQGIRYAADALRRVPGVAVSRSGSFGGATQIRLRGAEGNHVLVLVDGVEVAQGGGNELDFASLLASGIARIEVLRGAQSGLYGSNALAGVVSVITDDGSGGSGGVELSAEAGSFDTRQVMVGARGRRDDLHGALNLAYREAYLDASPTGGEKDGDENLSLSGRGGVALTEALAIDGGFRIVDRSVATDAQDFFSGAIIDAPDTADYDDVQLSSTATWSSGRWRTQLGGSRYEGDAAATDAFATARSTTRRSQIGLFSTVDLGGSAASAHSVTAFLQRERESYRDRSNPSLGLLARSTGGIGAEYRGSYGERVFFTGTLRSDRNDGFEDATTYRVAVAYLLGDARSRLHSSYGTGVTNPTFIEQFGFGSSWVGNPDLLPEEAEGWDIGFERQLGGDRLIFDVTAFESELLNEIEFAPPFFDRSRNRAGVSSRRGVELAIRGTLTDRLGVNAAFTYTDAQDPPPEQPAEEVRRPPRMASVDLYYATASGRLQLHAGAVYNGKMLDVDPDLGFAKGPVASYTLVSFGATLRVAERLELFARVENLLDEDYEEVIGYATPGRGVLAGARWRLARTGGER